jgi:peptidoglycan-N-acetylglucosamine deacetylase
MHWIWSLISVLSFRRVRLRMPSHDGAVYLTFDDGPHPDNTPVLLDMLAALQIKATFFLIGEQAKAQPELVRRLVQDRHVLGNHSMTHPRMRGLARDAQLSQIDAADEILAQFDGRRRHMFRPPRGHATAATISRAVLHDQPLVLWSFDSLDHKLGVDALVERLERHVPKGGDILLFHDDMQATIAALRTVLPRWRAAGVRFATL